MSAVKTLLFSNSTNLGLLVFRLLMGSLMVVHGAMKFAGGEALLTGVGSTLQIFGVTDYFYFFGIMASASELLGGILVVFGLFTRLATIMLIGTLAVATVVMSSNGFNAMAHPLEVGVGFLMLFIAGPGKYSGDNKLAK